MNRRRMIIALCLMAVTSSALALGGGMRVAKIRAAFLPQAVDKATMPPLNDLAPKTAALSQQVQQQNKASTQPPVEVPKQIVYGILFREMAVYKKKAEEKEAKGENATALRQHHKEKLKLNDEQFVALDRIAAESNRKVEKLDASAKKIIDSFRAQFTDRKLKAGDPVSPPPAELKSLQAQRDATILAAREELRRALGEAEFKRLDDFVQQDISSKLKPVENAPINIPASDDPRIQRARERRMK